MRNNKLVAFISGSPIIASVDIAIEAHKNFLFVRLRLRMSH